LARGADEPHFGQVMNAVRGAQNERLLVPGSLSRRAQAVREHDTMAG
jgi:hypothetical protein